jgi:hypothetical protein
MIAIVGTTCRRMLTSGGTVTYTATRTSVADNGWREVTVDDLETIKLKEPAQERDEPDTGERPVYCERPHRRLATVTGLRRPIGKAPQQAASTWG